tara:strand:+ start:5808 stop:5927 length:120 start_codon:yes stop_codon:yes gene_type:complete
MVVIVSGNLSVKINPAMSGAYLRGIGLSDRTGDPATQKG